VRQKTHTIIGLCFNALAILMLGFVLYKNDDLNNTILPFYIAVTSLYIAYVVFVQEKLFSLKKTKKIAHESMFDDVSFLHTINLEDLYNAAPAGDVLVDAEGKILDYNKTFESKFVSTYPNLRGSQLTDILNKDDRDAVKRCMQKVILQDRVESVEFRFEWGAEGVAYMGLFKQRLKEGLVDDAISDGTYYFVQIFDNSEQKSTQLRLIQSQKTQAMGQLAGGIAHDFNNLLTAMIGFCDLLLLRHSPGDQSFTDIMQIKQNANRAANLVRQLLAFSKQQTLQPRVINITESLAELSILLQRLIGAGIMLRIHHGQDLGLVRVDQGQFEQVIINLVVNARDAINNSGGEIMIKTENKTLKKPLVLEHETVQPGQYVLIEVNDNGSGIKQEHIDRIFDPFFSTKEIGSGTGLGLATVQGIVTQTGGYVTVVSQASVGTKFSIYLPLYDGENDESSTSAERQTSQKDLTGSGRILIVEDEDAVRIFSARALRDKGYNVIEASNGEEGIHILKQMIADNCPPDLLITDVVMPFKDGPALVNESLSILPNLKVIFISGYAEDAFRKKIHQNDEINFIAKPFSLKSMAQKVKEIMESRPAERMDHIDAA
jgi:two-component system cell cycle sensor histidine kinase/response regulator CckA